MPCLPATFFLPFKTYSAFLAEDELDTLRHRWKAAWHRTGLPSLSQQAKQAVAARSGGLFPGAGLDSARFSTMRLAAMVAEYSSERIQCMKRMVGPRIPGIA
jgi:hypothetical protein